MVLPNQASNALERNHKLYGHTYPGTGSQCVLGRWGGRLPRAPVPDRGVILLLALTPCPD